MPLLTDSKSALSNTHSDALDIFMPDHNVEILWSSDPTIDQVFASHESLLSPIYPCHSSEAANRVPSGPQPHLKKPKRGLAGEDAWLQCKENITSTSPHKARRISSLFTSSAASPSEARRIDAMFKHKLNKCKIREQVARAGFWLEMKNDYLKSMNNHDADLRKMIHLVGIAKQNHKESCDAADLLREQLKVSKKHLRSLKRGVPISRPISQGGDS